MHEYPVIIKEPITVEFPQNAVPLINGKNTLLAICYALKYDIDEFKNLCSKFSDYIKIIIT